MAKSSFEYFRKHTKVAVILLGALCMLAFVVAEPLLQYLNGPSAGGRPGGRGGDDVVVTWDGGELTEGELGTLVARRQLLMSFLTAVEREGRDLAVEAGVPAEVGTSVEPLRLPVDRDQLVEQDVLQSSLFAEEAAKMGMVISDETIVDYLHELGRGYVTRERMREMIKSIPLGNGSATPEFVFGMIREALLARNYVASYAYARATVLPEQRWSDWLKVNDRVVIETARLNVDDFVALVDDPTDEEVQGLYDEYKGNIPGEVYVNNTPLPSPTPGFRTPAMAKAQYLKTDFAAATQAAMPEITEEQIAEYYEENKVMFIKSELDLAGDEEADPMEAEQEGLGIDAGQGASDDAAPAEPPAEGEASDAPEDGAASEPAATDSGAISVASPFRLATFQETDDREANTPDEQTASGEEATVQPAEDASELEDPMAEFMKSGGDEEGASGDESPSAGGSDAEPEKPVEYQPLEEVSQEIRERLAEEKAEVDMQQRMQDLLGILENEYNSYFVSRIDAESAKKPAPDPPEALLDWQKIADDNHLEFGESKLLSYKDLRDSDLGQLRVPVDESPLPMPLAAEVFRPGGMELYEPEYAVDLDRNHYLVMKIESIDERVPELDEVRDRVIAAWKKQKAAEITLERAKSLAKEAESAGVSLRQKFLGERDVKVEESDRFGWLEPFLVSQYGEQDLRLGDPGTIPGAGPDFMQTVFSLGPTEYGAALDHGQNAAYVIRIALRESSQEELRQNFLRDINDFRLKRARDRKYAGEVARAVFYDLIGGEKPAWKRTPDSEPVGDAG